jgi:hypothetical protein
MTGVVNSISVVEAGGSARAEPAEAIAAVTAAMQPPIVCRIRIAFSFQAVRLPRYAQRRRQHVVDRSLRFHRGFLG